MVRLSPIFKIDDKTIVAVPVGFAAAESANLFCDRVLAEVLKKPTKRVILVLTGLGPDLADNPIWDALATDLKTQKVRVERK